jgi:hypothetical protein
MRQLVESHVDGLKGYRVLMSAHPHLMTREAQAAILMSTLSSLRGLGEPVADVVDRVGLAYGVEIGLTERDSSEALPLRAAVPA